MHKDFGFGWVQIGVNDCEWVPLGALGHMHAAGCKNKTSRDKIGHAGYVFAMYGQGKFPGHHVLWILPKMINNEYKLAMVHKDGCNRMYDHEGTEKTKQKEH